MTSPSPQELAQRVLALLEKHQRRVVILINGSPGSGKTTVANAVAAVLNAKQPGTSAVVGMDGFHLTRAQLQQMPDAQTAVRRRGAPFTFDARGAVAMAQALRTPDQLLRYPTFDHAAKDPVPNGGAIGPQVRVVLFEGLYVLLNDEPWRQIRTCADETWQVVTTPQLARDRVARRHVASGICADLDSALALYDSNDLPNSAYIDANSAPADVTVASSSPV